MAQQDGELEMGHFLPAGTVVLAPVCTAAGATRRHGDPRDAENVALKADVDALRERLDADEAAQRTTALQEQPAAAAQQQATTALTQSQKARVAAATPVEPLPKTPAPGVWRTRTIGTRVLLNVSNIDQTSRDLLGDRTENVQNGAQTERKRGYFIVKHQFGDTRSANIPTEVRYLSNRTSKDVVVFVKKGWVQARINPALNIRVGKNDAPSAPFVESLYGYRSKDTLIDRTKIGASPDWSTHVFGTFGHNLATYRVSATNGARYKSLSRNSNRVELEGRLGIKPVTLRVGGYSGMLGKTNGTVDVNHPATCGRCRRRLREQAGAPLRPMCSPSLRAIKKKSRELLRNMRRDRSGVHKIEADTHER
jgi:hypothetical protein